MGYFSLFNNTNSNNTAIGYYALYNNNANYNTAVGYNSGITLVSGENNVIIGDSANVVGGGIVETTIVGSNSTASNRSAVLGAFAVGNESSVVIGHGASAGAGTNSVVIGRGAASTATNQFVVGSAAYNAGTVSAEVNTSTKVWNVVINGTAYKILLA